MADLLDIAPSTSAAIVMIGNLRITVRGVSVDAIASIVSRFPALKSLTADAGGDLVSRLIAGCGQAVGPIIAAGCGHRDEEAYEQHAAVLLPEQQLKLLRAIFGLTFPNGYSAFVEELTGLIGGAKQEAKGPLKVRFKKSPSPSPHLSEADSRPTMQ